MKAPKLPIALEYGRNSITKQRQKAQGFSLASKYPKLAQTEYIQEVMENSKEP